MAGKQLQNLIVNEDQLFSMSFEEFVREFPAKYSESLPPVLRKMAMACSRSHDGVKDLYRAIQWQQVEKIKIVEEKFIEAVEKASNRQVTSNADAEYVLKMARRLNSNLSKDVTCLDESIEEMTEMFNNYCEYLENRVKSLVEEFTAEKTTINDQKDFELHLELLRLPG
ncbi:uncharacterized protein LOC143445637 isoform X2 [Clavelina lepadiformis]|uniref:uncharacterized protein LOC143445637 isoform X2 n=1 Tax=Clavelina lepadiformis TaxID=159417 RepID=UPI004042C066